MGCAKWSSCSACTLILCLVIVYVSVAAITRLFFDEINNKSEEISMLGGSR
jgi:hypothetical protein